MRGSSTSVGSITSRVTVPAMVSIRKCTTSPVEAKSLGPVTQISGYQIASRAIWPGAPGMSYALIVWKMKPGSVSIQTTSSAVPLRGMIPNRAPSSGAQRNGKP